MHSIYKFNESARKKQGLKVSEREPVSIASDIVLSKQLAKVSQNL
ncbi:Hypothetical protein LOCK900_2538 [Lacticaseibacillus rhamnosus LOCK900]|nr:Hypothetical protein LOCK900_2538 [Lacticaseibacillus rhamnosus LOCK900]